MKTALLFPGQGSQRVGMGRDLAHAHVVAQRTYDEADAALGFAISKLCFDGPEDELQLTPHTQPAILTTSIAVYRVLESRGLAYDVAAGGRHDHDLARARPLDAQVAVELAELVQLVVADRSRCPNA